MPKLHFLTIPVLALLVNACGADSPVTPTPIEPQFAISDGGHAAGNPHFYFLPPMVPPAAYAGTFDPGAEPTVQICQLESGRCLSPLVAEFNMAGGPGSEAVRLDLDAEQYVVMWHTGQFNLDSASTYRIRVLVQELEVGFADVALVSRGRESLEVDPDNLVAVVNGSSLPIKFRVETGAVECAPQVAVDVNNMVLALQAGVLPPGAGFQNNGTFRGTGVLYGGGLAYGTSATDVIVGYDPIGINASQLDPTAQVCAIRHGTALETSATVRPLVSFPSVADLLITQHSYAWSDASDQGYVLLTYTFRNTGSAPVTGLFAGLVMDWDLLFSGRAGDDLAVYDSAFLIAQALEAAGYPRVGLQANSYAPLNYAGFRNGGFFPTGDPRTPADYYALLSGGIRAPVVGPWDIRSALSFGPVSIAPGEARRFTFAVVGGLNQTEYMLSYNMARAKAVALGLF